MGIGRTCQSRVPEIELNAHIINKKTKHQTMKYLKIFIIFLSLSAIGISCSKEGDSTLSPNGKSGSITKFTVVGDYMYCLNSSNLDVYDIRIPEDPVKINSIKIARVTETIFSYYGRLYIGAPDGVYIVDISTPTKPVLKGSETHFVGCDPVVVKDYIAYSTIRTGRECNRGTSANFLLVMDVSNAENPRTLKSIPMTFPSGLGYDKNTLFVCDGEAGVKVFDISKLNNPVEINTIKGLDAYDLITDNGTLIVSSPTTYSFYDYTDLNKIVLKYTINKT